MVMHVEENSSKRDSVSSYVDIIAEIAFDHCERQSRFGSIKIWAPTSGEDIFWSRKERADGFLSWHRFRNRNIITTVGKQV